MKVKVSVVSDSLRPHGLQPTRLLCPWDSPGKNIGVDCHSLLQGICPTQGSNLGLPYCKQILYRLEPWITLIFFLILLGRSVKFHHELYCLLAAFDMFFIRLWKLYSIWILLRVFKITNDAECYWMLLWFFWYDCTIFSSTSANMLNNTNRFPNIEFLCLSGIARSRILYSAGMDLSLFYLGFLKIHINN